MRGIRRTGSHARKRILIDPGSHHGLNLGDVAMLQVAVTRLRRLWADCRIQVLTSEPHTLLAHQPGVEPIPASGRYDWFDGRAPSWGAARRHGKFATRAAVAIERAIRMPGEDVRTLLDALGRSDLLLVPGRGGLTDAFRTDAMAVLDLVQLAGNLGVPVALMGQGVGPMSDASLRRRASEVLPHAAFITLREGRVAPSLLTELGVSQDRMAVTGDEALALVTGEVTVSGRLLGVNLRRADYAGVRDDSVARVASILRHVLGRIGAEPVAIPVSLHPLESDLDTAVALTGSTTARAPDSVRELVRATGRCRAVVAGSYHAAVFALGHGVPVVALAASQYYVDKMCGLDHQFPGGGCQVLRLDDPELADRLPEAVLRAWDAGDELRAGLRESAAEQVRAAASAWSQLPSRLG